MVQTRKTREAEFVDRLRRQVDSATQDLALERLGHDATGIAVAEVRLTAYAHVLTMAEGWFQIPAPDPTGGHR